MNQTDYICTRPRLATQLINLGFTATIETNPWDLTKKAWVFPLDHELAEAVLNYYQSIGERAPAVIQQYFGVSAGALHQSHSRTAEVKE